MTADQVYELLDSMNVKRDDPKFITKLLLKGETCQTCLHYSEMGIGIPAKCTRNSYNTELPDCGICKNHMKFHDT